MYGRCHPHRPEPMRRINAKRRLQVKAIVCRELGPPEKLVFEEVKEAPMGAGEVRIAIKGAGVNFPDTLIIQGT